MPGGYIGVHTGLILSSQTESELAGVLGTKSRTSRSAISPARFSQSKQVGMASMVAMALALLAARSSSQVAGRRLPPSQAGALSAQLAFSRDFEREADRQGFDILRKAGFDVRGMAAFFRACSRRSDCTRTTRLPISRTHPLTGERLTDMQNREQAVPYRQVVDSADFQLVRAKVRLPCRERRAMRSGSGKPVAGGRSSLPRALSVTASPMPVIGLVTGRRRGKSMRPAS